MQAQWLIEKAIKPQGKQDQQNNLKPMETPNPKQPTRNDANCGVEEK
jgi:hypothetical protein